MLSHQPARVTCSNRSLQCEGEDLNLHGSYPTSTSSSRENEKRGVSGAEERRSTHLDTSALISSGRVPQAPSVASDMASEARALLTLAALREAILAERARAFAAGVLAESELGRWALAVLRDEPCAARALVELANAGLQRDTVGVKPPNNATPKAVLANSLVRDRLRVMAPASARLVRAEDGSESILLSLEEFQALLDAASAAEHGIPETKQVVAELKRALTSSSGYIDASTFLEQYDALHGSR